LKIMITNFEAFKVIRYFDKKFEKFLRSVAEFKKNFFFYSFKQSSHSSS
jgi:hypothetical protein